MIVNYQKRKNIELFKALENPKTLFLTEAQNYIPIYSKFFSLNETNFNNINLNHKWYITNINCDEQDADEENNRIFNCKLKNINNNKTKDKDVFFKLAPLLDPYKYLVGKYNVHDEKLYKLPKLDSTDDNCINKFIDVNNAAYIDGLFVHLTSALMHTHSFIHGVDYYGSFLGIKNNFNLNIFDDIEYLNTSDFFNKNKNVLFKVDEYEHLFQDENEKCKLKPIKIQHNTSATSQLSISSFDNELFGDVFDENMLEISNMKINDTEINDTEINDTCNFVNLTDNLLVDTKNENQFTIKSNSTCSSRTSYTDDEDIMDECNMSEDGEDNEIVDNDEDISMKDENDDDNDNFEDVSDDEYEDEIINATIQKFPIQMICMEYCENTFDDLILNNKLKEEEWKSAFMQIIMILITYQKAFNLTHNDLHTNNVMYNHTDKKFIYYCYKKKYYKVPTFGRIFKIIDFGRSIYKFDGKIFCSDSFQMGGDAATQYNTEPYLNEKKPRLEPNYSFDLCRLACSIFDYVVDDDEDLKELSKSNDPIKRLIVEWCLDDNGINMLYKNNGDDRYPDFKLYKMIARCVHNHTPQAQLERPEFKAFSNFKDKNEIPVDVIDIDNIPSYV
jgi:hypothetical protein